MHMRDKITGTDDTARHYVERIARDEDLHDHVKKAYDSARKIDDELIGPSGPTGMAFKVAKDKDLQDELKKAVEELRKAGVRAQGRSSHGARNMTLLLAGIALGVLFNPATGPDTRKWLRDKVLGPEEPFEYQSNGPSSSSSS